MCLFPDCVAAGLRRGGNLSVRLKSAAGSQVSSLTVPSVAIYSQDNYSSRPQYTGNGRWAPPATCAAPTESIYGKIEPFEVPLWQEPSDMCTVHYFPPKSNPSCSRFPFSANSWVVKTFCSSHASPSFSWGAFLSISCSVSPTTLNTAKNSYLPAMRRLCALGQSSATCQTQVKSQAPDTDPESPLPHAFAIGVRNRYGVIGRLSRV